MLLPLTALLVAAAPASAPVAVAPSDSCIVMNHELPLASRKSPLDSTSFTLSGKTITVCYGRPSSRGRTMIGGDAVPYGKLWRTGANEPTMIHTPVPLEIAGIKVPAGTYSLYTIPGKREWTIIVNRSITQWGEEHSYTAEVKAQDVGRATVPSGTTPQHVETFTIRAEPKGADAADLILEWESTRVVIPITTQGT